MGEGVSQGSKRRGDGGVLGRQVQQQQGEGGVQGRGEEAPCNSWSQLSMEGLLSVQEHVCLQVCVCV